MVQRERRGAEGNALRLLPLHVAMEYFLLLHFGGPDIAYGDYSRRAVRYGIGPRSEWAWKGSSLPGFEEALRVFEVREGQVGVLVFVADAFTSAFVTPHPDDYRALHRTLLSDFYGDLIWHYAVQYREVASVRAPLDASRVSSLADLRAEVARARGEWAAFHEMLAMGLLKDRPLRTQKVYEAGPFTLARFMTGGIDPSWENHIGEAIVRRETGEVEYLKTYRLSAEQARRAFLLEALASADWEAAKAAAKLNLTQEQLVLRFEQAELGHVFHGDVRAKAQKWRRQLMEG
jgi:hypothetical protein